MVTKRPLLIAFALLVVIAINLALLTAGIWAIEESPQNPQWLSKSAIGLLIADVALIGVWFGLGDWRWYLRLPVAVALTITVARCFGWAGMLSRRSGQTELDQSMMI